MVKLVVIILVLLFFEFGCNSGAFMGNPSIVRDYGQPDLRDDGLNTLPKVEKAK